MHGKVVEGRPLVVRVRSDPTPAPGQGGPRPFIGHVSFSLLSLAASGCHLACSGPAPLPVTLSLQDNVNTVYVTALNPTVTEPALRDLFEKFGRVSHGRGAGDAACCSMAAHGRAVTVAVGSAPRMSAGQVVLLS